MGLFVQQKPGSLATSRICMAVATAAASSGADKAQALAQHALELAKGAAADMVGLGSPARPATLPTTWPRQPSAGPQHM